METTIELSKAILVEGTATSTLTLQEPTLDALEDIHLSLGGEGVKVRLGDVLPFIARTAHIPMSSVRQISVADFPKLMGVYMDFLGLSQKAGEALEPK